MKRERTQLLKCVNKLLNTTDEEFRDGYYSSELLDTFEDMVSWLQERRDTKSKYDDEEACSGDDEV